MNVNAMIKRLGGKLYSVTRPKTDVTGQGSYSSTDGTFVPGATEVLQILGSLQPMTAEELISIPEGDRARERFRFYSFSPLKNDSNALLKQHDAVDVNGVSYEVEKVEHWPNHGKAVIVRANTNEN